MRVSTTLGSLILSAGLVAARACAPHPRPTTTTSAGGVDTTTDVASASTTLAATSDVISQDTTTVIESPTNVESSVTLSTSVSVEASVSTELSTTVGPTSEETAITTTFETAVTSSAALSTFETSATSAEATTTTASPPVETVNLVENGGFEDATMEPWEVMGTTPSLQGGFASEGTQSLSLPKDFEDNAAVVCQRVAVEQGFEYTFKVSVAQNCIFSFGSNIVSCEDNANKIQLTIDGVYFSEELGITDYNTFHEVSQTFSYVGPSIDSTDLCITIKVIDAAYYNFYLDGISLVKGQAVPIPEETD
ncbi:hypothetical protein ACLX1H_011328 [Fusarium chlamydosporum]